MESSIQEDRDPQTAKPSSSVCNSKVYLTSDLTIIAQTGAQV